MVSLFNHETQQLDLTLVSSPNQVEILAECASMIYSLSPDGSQIVYLNFVQTNGIPDQCTGGYLVTLTNSLEAMEVAIERFSDIGDQPLVGWTDGDHPLWALEQNAIIFPSQPMWIIPLDGSIPYTPRHTGAFDGDYLPKTFNPIWSPETKQLIGDVDAGMSGRGGVWIFSFSPELQTITELRRIEDIPTDGNTDISLLGWWTPGESILLSDMHVDKKARFLSEWWGAPAIWNLQDNTWTELTTE